jgi:hypothetical protein
MSDTDPLRHFAGSVSCPVCGCLDRKGVYRCAECGTFHAGSIMEEREAPPPQVRSDEPETPLDPSIYSLGPNAAIPEETFDESDDVREWGGGSTDFSFEEDDEPPLRKEATSLPEPEVVNED